MRRVLVLPFALAAVLAMAPAALAQEHSAEHNHLVVLTGGAHVTEEQSFHDVVVFDGDVVVDGVVHDKVVVFHGDLTVSGFVNGDVVVFDGDVTIASEAEVNGDVASFSEPVIEEGATVRGEVRRPSRDFFTPMEVFAARAAMWVAATVSFFILGALLLWLAPRGMESIANVWRDSKGSAVLWGVALLIGLPLAAVVSLVSLVGIPLGIGVLLALWLLFSIGFVSGAWALGRSVVREGSSRWLAFLAGLGIARLLGLIPIVGGIISFLVTVAGLGLVAVAVWRSRAAPTPAPAPAA